MTKAPGTKKKTAARIQRLMEDGPLWPAAAIQRGPSTVAMLKSSTSQKPIVLRNCAFGLAGGAGIVIGLRCAWIFRMAALGNDIGRRGAVYTWMWGGLL